MTLFFIELITVDILEADSDTMATYNIISLEGDSNLNLNLNTTLIDAPTQEEYASVGDLLKDVDDEGSEGE